MNQTEKMGYVQKSEFRSKILRGISTLTWPSFVGVLMFIGIALWKILSIATEMRDVEYGVKESSFLGLHLYTVMVDGNTRTLMSHWGLILLLLLCLLVTLAMKLVYQRFKRG